MLHEKGGELVAQIKGTVLLMPNGSDVITKSPVQAVSSDKKVEDAAILELLTQPIKKQKKKVREREDTMVYAAASTTSAMQQSSR